MAQIGIEKVEDVTEWLIGALVANAAVTNRCVAYGPGELVLLSRSAGHMQAW